MTGVQSGALPIVQIQHSYWRQKTAKETCDQARERPIYRKEEVRGGSECRAGRWLNKKKKKTKKETQHEHAK